MLSSGGRANDRTVLCDALDIYEFVDMEEVYDLSEAAEGGSEKSSIGRIGGLFAESGI